MLTQYQSANIKIICFTMFSNNYAQEGHLHFGFVCTSAQFSVVFSLFSPSLNSSLTLNLTSTHPSFTLPSSLDPFFLHSLHLSSPPFLSLLSSPLLSPPLPLLSPPPLPLLSPLPLPLSSRAGLELLVPQESQVYQELMHPLDRKEFQVVTGQMVTRDILEKEDLLDHLYETCTCTQTV